MDFFEMLASNAKEKYLTAAYGLDRTMTREQFESLSHEYRSLQRAARSFYGDTKMNEPMMAIYRAMANIDYRVSNACGWTQHSKMMKSLGGPLICNRSTITLKERIKYNLTHGA